ncbi:hypothetical protein SU48_11665 [Deinococcus puniceus]|uniref:Lipoprotein n=1 Tax=Deinococcus puniceus TaxID=1182568 RepID=A0A172TD52_9DEIO|nr:hypothetical protein SU48_11665 [Deinococcus puniceus]
MRPKRLPFLLLPLLLAACTGTEEGLPVLRLAVLTDGGATLRTVTTGGISGQPAPTEVTVPVTGGVSLDTLPGGGRAILTLAAGLESRDANLATPQAFAAPPFTPVCLTSTATSATRDRLLTLSACPNGPQQLALYRSDGTLIWTATLPTFTPPIPGPDTPPVRLAVLGETGMVARPALGGGSEVVRAAPATTGDPVAAVTTPLLSPSIRDLAPYGTSILAATDTGVQTLGPTGLPDTAQPVAAFGSGRVDRLWTNATGNRSLLAAWRDNASSGASSEPLRLWDGVRPAAATVAFIDRLRDVTLAPDGNLYALTPFVLTRYDTVFGLQQGNWQPTTLLSGLNDARAVTWLVP